MSHLSLDAEQLYAELKRGVQALLAGSATATHLVGVATGGAWLAERLHTELGLPGRAGVISSTLHRDDYVQRGLRARGGQTSLPFEVGGAEVLLIDDVLYTGKAKRPRNWRANFCASAVLACAAPSGWVGMPTTSASGCHSRTRASISGADRSARAPVSYTHLTLPTNREV